MKKLSLLCIAVMLISASPLQAQDYKTALGIRLSSNGPAVNNSVSFKHFMNPKLAVEALLTFDNKAAIGGLLEIHNDMSTEGLKWFYGAGAYIGFDSDKENTDRALMGAQGIIGLDYKFANLPLNLSLDWKPELNIIDNINFEPAAVGFTIRFTFGKSQPQTVSE
ncbi:MAG TPA: hypothetical protein VJ765_11505 [Chitinophagaceae bacterium]|nr:hypothetical protein [Chitinophagaceae bacterium]